MKIELQISAAREDEVRRLLAGAGIEVGGDGADFILTERGVYAERLCCRDGDAAAVIPVSGILYFESFGHDISAVTAEKTYRASDSLTRLAAALDPREFMRISNSVIVKKTAITSIGVSFSRKFTLRLSCGAAVDVTRSYFYKFKEWMGI